jgi:hypothetical protein
LIAGVIAVILNLIIPPELEELSNIVEHPENDAEAQPARDSGSIDETKKERPADPRRGTVE